MKKVAVIIKHPFRHCDWRVDIYEVPEEAERNEIHDYVMSNMLGPFEIIAITSAVSFDCKMPLAQNGL
jgi:hypothetical protein